MDRNCVEVEAIRVGSDLYSVLQKTRGKESRLEKRMSINSETGKERLVEQLVEAGDALVEQQLDPEKVVE